MPKTVIKYTKIITGFLLCFALLVLFTYLLIFYVLGNVLASFGVSEGESIGFLLIYSSVFMGIFYITFLIYFLVNIIGYYIYYIFIKRIARKTEREKLRQNRIVRALFLLNIIFTLVLLTGIKILLDLFKIDFLRFITVASMVVIPLGLVFIFIFKNICKVIAKGFKLAMAKLRLSERKNRHVSLDMQVVTQTSEFKVANRIVNIIMVTFLLFSVITLVLIF